MFVLSHVQLFVTLGTIDHQTLLSMEFYRQEYWSGLPFSSPEKKKERKNSNEGRDEVFGVIKLDIYTVW